MRTINIIVIAIAASAVAGFSKPAAATETLRIFMGHSRPIHR